MSTRVVCVCVCVCLRKVHPIAEARPISKLSGKPLREGSFDLAFAAVVYAVYHEKLEKEGTSDNEAETISGVYRSKKVEQGQQALTTIGHTHT